MNLTTTVSFPGLGIDAFSMNKVAFSVGDVEVRWYGVVITLGIVLAFLYAFWRGKRNEGIVFDDVIDIGLWTVILGVIGARLYYVLTTLNAPGHSYKNLIDVIAVWEGGLAIYGGIIGGCLGIFIACRIKKIDVRRAFDMIAPGVMIAQALGRWGNFFNGEAHGYPIAETTRFYFLNAEHTLPSGEGTLFHTLRMGLSHSSKLESISFYYHPTFLYECLWNLLGFALINLFYKHKKFHGQIAILYFTWYGFGRMLIEGFRTDSLFIPGTTLRISQCLGLACFTVGLIAVVVFTWILPAVRELKGGAASVAVIGEAAPVTEEEESNEPSVPEATDASEESELPLQTTESEDKENGNAD